tara:strand:+ start:1193 stop:2500 length:1308 start_codon:yes stop_codon:yes gene_type:complete
MKKLLVLQGPVTSRSGYGDHTRDILKSLISMDKYNIQVIDLRWGECPQNGIVGEDSYLKNYFLTDPLKVQPDVFIQVSVPNEFQPMGKFNIGITAGIETNICSAEWIQGLNRMNLIVVPSEHSKQVFLHSVYDQMDDRTRQKIGELKCTTPIEVLFEGADLNIWKKTNSISEDLKNQMDKIKETFCFLFVGHWLQGEVGHDRKDISSLIDTFIKTFKDNPSSTRPALILKTSSATFSILDRNDMLARINKRMRQSGVKNPPKIYLIHGDLKPSELNELYNHPKVKAHVSFTKGEGFGRPLLEATLSEKPVIASNWSGHIDFLKHSQLLPGNLQEIHKSCVWDKVLVKGSRWFYVNHLYAQKVLKDVFKNYKQYLPEAKTQAKFSATQFSLTKMKEDFVKILEKNIISEVKLKLPELKPLKEKSKISLPKLKKMEA